MELSMRVVAKRAPVTYGFLPGKPMPLVDTMPGMPKAPMALPRLCPAASFIGKDMKCGVYCRPKLSEPNSPRTPTTVSRSKIQLTSGVPELVP